MTVENMAAEMRVARAAGIVALVILAVWAVGHLMFKMGYVSAVLEIGATLKAADEGGKKDG